MAATLLKRWGGSRTESVRVDLCKARKAQRAQSGGVEMLPELLPAELQAVRLRLGKNHVKACGSYWRRGGVGGRKSVPARTEAGTGRCAANLFFREEAQQLVLRGQKEIRTLG